MRRKAEYGRSFPLHLIHKLTAAQHASVPQIGLSAAPDGGEAAPAAEASEESSPLEVGSAALRDPVCDKEPVCGTGSAWDRPELGGDRSGILPRASRY